VPTEEVALENDLSLQPSKDGAYDLISLGEILLRFDPGERRIVGARNFQVWEGGGEYNVARGLCRCFGLRTAIVSSLVDNAIGRLVEDLVLQGGVRTDHIQWRKFDGLGRDARNGIYFLERGFGVRGGFGMMDRGHTAMAQLKPGDIDWHQVFSKGVRWFHTGGITTALSESSTEVVRDAMLAAQDHGAIVSYDCNYRPSLWSSRGGRQGSIAANRSLMPLIDVLLGHEGDIARTAIASSHGQVWHTLDSFGEMAVRVREEYSNLKVIASSVRRAQTASRNDWSGFAFANGRAVEGLSFPGLEVLDRVGSGDGFAAGLIYGLLTGREIDYALNCGIAHGALVMTTPGDSSMASLAEVEHLMNGGQAATSR
jgi:2-dehydro-3-deoxygluconokinase